VGTGHSITLRWENTLPQTVSNQTIRVRSSGCTAACGADDVYRLRAYETSYQVPRFNNSSSQITVLFVQNVTDATVAGNLYFWSLGGSLIYTQPFSMPARSVMSLNTASITALVGRSGSVTVSHNAGYGRLAGKGVGLEPATGFSFDTVMEARARR
jgi:hypothetical protein